MRTLAFFSIFFAFSAKACPELAGVYKKCVSKTGLYQFSRFDATQKTVNGETIYSMAATDAETDIMQSPLTFKSNGTPLFMGLVYGDVPMQSSSICEDKTLKTVIEFDGGKEGYLNLDITKKNNRLSLRYYSDFGEEDLVECE